MIRAVIPQLWAPSTRKWTIDLNHGRFASPIARKQQTECLLAHWKIRDGWISTRIQFPSHGPREAGLALTPEKGGDTLLVGLGGWGGGYFVGETRPHGQKWKLIGSVNSSQDLRHRSSFELKVEFTGDQIRLYEGGVLQLEATRPDSNEGQLELWVDGCKATFSDVRVSPKRCFVIMPFAEEFDKIYTQIKSAAESKGLACWRADEKTRSLPIMKEVIDDIQSADLTIAELTSGNSNVYYEAGYAHSFNKECILIARSHQDVTFDLRGIGVLIYGDPKSNSNDPLGYLRTQLEHWIDGAVERLWARCRPAPDQT